MAAMPELGMCPVGCLCEVLGENLLPCGMPDVPGVLDLFWHFGQLGMQRLLGKGVAADFSFVDSAVSRQADSAGWSLSILCGLLCKCPREESLSTTGVLLVRPAGMLQRAWLGHLGARDDNV